MGRVRVLERFGDLVRIDMVRARVLVRVGDLTRCQETASRGCVLTKS